LSQIHDHDHEPAPANGLPYGWFTLSTLGQLAIALGAFYLISPTAFLAEFQHPWTIVLCTFLFGVPLSLFEYLYHRYLLHSSVLPFLGSMHKAHSHHHGLTNVKAPITPNEPAKMVPVESYYPIDHEHQEESMMFPYYALSIFYGVFIILLAIPAALIFRGAPVFSSVLFTATLCYSAYEIWHAITHLPFDKYWKPAMDNKYIGKMTKHAYGFHLMHHWRPVSNLAVVGFWGWAVWDHVFGTHRRPENMPIQGGEVTFKDAELKRPRFPIAQLDKLGSAFFKWSRKVESSLIGLFTRRKAH
jgi:hypothetical protein